MASGGRHGLAQSLFQVGGNTGQALGPAGGRAGGGALGTIQPGGLRTDGAAVDGAVLWNVSVWYKHHGLARMRRGARAGGPRAADRARTARASPCCWR
jgi:FSR family fosmidomycin resistance protein-like MFS transporter